MNDIFVTSDTHFFHKNILKYQPDERPFDSVEEMNEKIIENWNAVVKPNDLIYHLGDFAFAQPHKVDGILRRLNGQKFFIWGNHDKSMHDKAVASHFQWMRNYHELKIEKQYVVLHHFPILSWNRMHHGALHFYGHTHGSIPYVFEGQSLDVGVDTNECKPYNVRELIATLKAMDVTPYDPREREGDPR